MTHHPADPATDLIDRGRRGEEEALSALIGYAYPLVRRWALVQTGEPDEAEDLTQDVLVQMLRKLHTFQSHARFSTWLFQVTRNAAHDSRRRRQRRERLSSAREGWAPLTAQVVPDPSARLDRTALSNALATFFRELPPRQREVFDLVDLQGYSSVEAAEVLAIEPVSVRAHLFKARRLMRTRMMEEHPDLVEDWS